MQYNENQGVYKKQTSLLVLLQKYSKIKLGFKM